MSMLTNKRAELVAKLAELETARNIVIEAKVEEYRKVLEAQISKDNIDNIVNVIKALDEVIAYDEASINTAKTETSASTVETVARIDEQLESRPGMSTVVVPSRV